MVENEKRHYAQFLHPTLVKMQQLVPRNCVMSMPLAAQNRFTKIRTIFKQVSQTDLPSILFNHNINM